MNEHAAFWCVKEVIFHWYRIQFLIEVKQRLEKCFFRSCNVCTDQPSVSLSAAYMPQSLCRVIIRFLVDNLPLILILMIWGFMLYTAHSHVITQTHELQIWLRGPQLEQSDLFP